MTPAELSWTVLSTVRHAVGAGELRVEVPEKVVVQRPPRPGCGDYATNVALQLAGQAGLSPFEVAKILAVRLAKEPGIAQVEAVGAGFLNITLSARAYADVVRQVCEQGPGYGRGNGLADESVTVVPEPPHAVRATLVAEVVNGLLAAAGCPARRPPGSAHGRGAGHRPRPGEEPRPGRHPLGTAPPARRGHPPPDPRPARPARGEPALPGPLRPLPYPRPAAQRP